MSAHTTTVAAVAAAIAIAAGTAYLFARLRRHQQAPLTTSELADVVRTVSIFEAACASDLQFLLKLVAALRPFPCSSTATATAAAAAPPSAADEKMAATESTAASAGDHLIVPRQHVSRKGECDPCMYFVTAGAFHLVDDAAPDEILFTLRPGFFFGEMALLDAAVRRTVSVVADWKARANARAGSCQLMGLSKADFDRIAAAHPECLELVRAAGKERLEFTLAEQARQDKKAQ